MNFVTRNAPEKFPDFGEEGPGLRAPLIGADFPPLCLGLKEFRSFSTKHNLSFLQACAQRLWEHGSLTNVILCMRTAVNTSFKESKLALAGYSENED